MNIIELLKQNSDEKLRLFNAKLIPTISPDRILGISSPKLRALAKDIFDSQEGIKFLSSTPHFYLEENHLHGILIGLFKDIRQTLKFTEEFLPFIDNWATNDMTAMGLKRFSKNTAMVRPYVEKWLDNQQPYVVRFGVVCLMSYFLGDAFKEDDLNLLTKLKVKNDYYVDMAVAWYLSMALLKKYDVALKAIKDNIFDVWVHNKAIRKAVECTRIDKSKKAFLLTLRR